MDMNSIAWAAGIYEGEGCFAGSNGNKYVHVTQKDRWLCDRLEQLFGGRVGQYKNHYRWFLFGNDARGFLLTIFSFLSPRRKRDILVGKEFLIRLKCKNGLHDYNDDNIRAEKTRNRGIVKYCLPCRRINAARKSGR